MKIELKQVDNNPAVYQALFQDPAPVRGRPVNTKLLLSWEGVVALGRAVKPILDRKTDEMLVNELPEGTTKRKPASGCC